MQQFIEQVRASILYEGDKGLKASEIEKLYNLKDLREIVTIFSRGIITDIRSENVVIGQHGKFLDKFAHIGQHYSEIDLNKLQKLTEETDEIKKMINYILFERIHPFIDCNGRTGRLLFCNDISLGLLNNKVIQALHDKILKKYSFPQDGIDPRFSDGLNTDHKYWEMEITDETLNDIIHFLTLTKLYNGMYFDGKPKYLINKEISKQYILLTSK